MPMSLLSIRVAVLALFVSGAAAAAQDAPPPHLLPPVVLQDQFDVSTTVNALRAPVIVLVAGRAGSEAMKRWMLVLRNSAPAAGVRVLPIADLKGAPFFIKGRIKASMPKDTSARILLDWDGKLARPVRANRGDLVVVVYSSDGKLKGWESVLTTREDSAHAQRWLKLATEP